MMFRIPRKYGSLYWDGKDSTKSPVGDGYAISQRAKLTADAVRDMRQPYRDGLIAEMAQKYGVRAGSVTNIRAGLSWKHILP